MATDEPEDLEISCCWDGYRLPKNIRYFYNEHGAIYCSPNCLKAAERTDVMRDWKRFERYCEINYPEIKWRQINAAGSWKVLKKFRGPMGINDFRQGKANGLFLCVPPAIENPMLTTKRPNFASINVRTVDNARYLPDQAASMQQKIRETINNNAAAIIEQKPPPTTTTTTTSFATSSLSSSSTSTSRPYYRQRQPTPQPQQPQGIEAVPAPLSQKIQIDRRTKEIRVKRIKDPRPKIPVRLIRKENKRFK